MRGVVVEVLAALSAAVFSLAAYDLTGGAQELAVGLAIVSAMWFVEHADTRP